MCDFDGEELGRAGVGLGLRERWPRRQLFRVTQLPLPLALEVTIYMTSESQKTVFQATGWHLPLPGCIHSHLYKKLPFLFPWYRMPSTCPALHLPIYPTGFQSGLGDGAPGNLSFLCETPRNIDIFNSIIRTKNDFSSRIYGHSIRTQVSATQKKNNHT